MSELRFFEKIDYLFGVEIRLHNPGVNVEPLFERLRAEIPGINCNLVPLAGSILSCVDVMLPTSALVTPQNKLKILEAINAFEPIEPLAIFVRMKRALGIDLTGLIDSYQAQIQKLYADGDFDSALALALGCKEAGISGLVHGLAQRCLEAKDYENITKAIQHESEPDSIYELAFHLFTSSELDGIRSRRDKLKITMQLFDLCGPLKEEAIALKAQIFAELVGQSFDPELCELATDLPGDSLCKIADLLFSRGLPGHGRPHAFEVTVMRGFSGGASGGCKSDASTQTDSDGSAPK